MQNHNAKIKNTAYRPIRPKSVENPGAPGEYFLTNKANLPKGKMSANIYLARDYEDKRRFWFEKNKANQSQFCRWQLRTGTLPPCFKRFWAVLQSQNPTHESYLLRHNERLTIRARQQLVGLRIIHELLGPWIELQHRPELVGVLRDIEAQRAFDGLLDRIPGFSY